MRSRTLGSTVGQRGTLPELGFRGSRPWVIDASDYVVDARFDSTSA